MNMKKGIVAGLAALAVACPAISASAAPIGYSDQNVYFYVTPGEETKVSLDLDIVPIDVPCHEPHRNITIQVSFPEGTLPEGAYTFVADALLSNSESSDSALYEAYTDLINAEFQGREDELLGYDVFNFSVVNENGDHVSPAGAVITITSDSEYNIVFVLNEDGSYDKDLVYKLSDGSYSFKAPHFSRFILANVNDPEKFVNIYQNSESEIIYESSVIESSVDPIVSYDDEKSDTSPASETTSDTQSNPLPRPDDKGANTGANGAAFAAAFGGIALVSVIIAASASKARKTSK